MKATIYHNPHCSHSRDALAHLRDHGIEPVIIEYLKSPLDADEIMDLVNQLGVPLRDVIREKEPVYEKLGLAHVDEDTLLAAMVMHPILLARPIVVTPKGAKLCRPSETVVEII